MADIDTPASSSDDEKVEEEPVGSDSDSEGNIVYSDAEHEPELSSKTWVALASMFSLHFVQLAFIGRDLNATTTQTWIPNALSLVQAVVGPVISSASDKFQVRKTIIIVSCLISFVGSAIAPGSQSFGRLLAATVLIGFGFAAAPLAFCIPSEVVPKKWYPAVQGFMNIAEITASVSSPLIIGALVRDRNEGWRYFYWIQMALWGVTAIGVLFGYKPPKRHTQYDDLSLLRKLGTLDLPGFFLLTAGLTLFLVGLGLGGEQFPWASSQVLATLIVGIIVLIGFGIYEWKGTTTGILHHELFQGGKERGRTFALCAVLIFLEGVLLFSMSIIYPMLSESLFTTDPFQIAVRSQPYWVAAAVTSISFGWLSTHFKAIRLPIFFGFALYTGAVIGMSTIQPGQSTNALVFAGMAGLGYGSPLVLIIAATQLAVPHHLIATAVSVITSARSVAATIFTASYTAAINNRLTTLIPSDIPPALISAGLPSSSVPIFIQGLRAHNDTLIQQVPGVTPAIVSAGQAAYRQVEADSIRVVYEIAAPFGAVACIVVWFMGSLGKLMTYNVAAPLEDLKARQEHGHHGLGHMHMPGHGRGESVSV